ncbi:MAG TPA: carboxypeptidase-like regulatory domain-containing protein [Verrucomicrobiae bacterium]|nr:carboxypeptidase-like regulatory domain-containing protein [Verrucomicrobiae bacterium]
MKTMKFLFALEFLLAGMCPAAFAAVTFTDSPSSVSNTYSGFITLQISGLTSGDTVVVQKFLDANANGIVDRGDELVQQFNLADNQPGQVIDNVTNYNVPCDTNSTGGAITTSLNFQNGDFVQNLIGKYLYVLSSPSNHFAPITNSFTVTNFPFGQKFTGNVVSNSTSTTLSNAIVLLFPPPRSGHNGPGQPLAGTVAKAGAYTVAAPPGTYTLVSFYTNFVSSFGTAPILTLGSGQTITTNLSLNTNATATISGTLVDASNNAVKLPGVFMPLTMNTNNTTLLAVAFSDTNGNFSARVISGPWDVGSDDSGLIVHGYVGYNNGTNVNSGSSGVIIPFPKANALFYGSVKDNSGKPFVGVGVGANESSNLFNGDGYTDPSGNYFVGVLGLTNDSWQLNLSGDNNSFTNYIISQPSFDQNGGTNLTIGTAVLENLTALLATNTISGTVKDNNNSAITNVQVFANATISGVDYSSQANTDVNGNYSLNVAGGVWYVSVSCGGGNNSLPSNYQCPNSLTVNISNNNVVTNFVVYQCGNVLITTPSPLPSGETGNFYSQNLQASSCYESFTWQQTAGTLPTGLSLQTNGFLGGIPSSSGAYNFTVQVTDGNNSTTNQVYSLSISNGVSITSTSLPNGTNGFNYSEQLQATNGFTPYNWSVTSGSLPASFGLSSGGVISGHAASGGIFNFTAQVTDNLGATATQPYTLTLVDTNIPPVAIASAGSQVFVLWPASAGTNFILETTTNLATGPWVPATNGVPQTAYMFTNAGSGAAFFRLQ